QAGCDVILEALGVVIAEADAATPGASAEAGPTGSGRWRIRFRLPNDALIYGTNPLLLLEEIRGIGPCSIVALTDTIPPLDLLDPEVPYLGWQVDLTADDPRAAIDDVFLFLKDG